MKALSKTIAILCFFILSMPVSATLLYDNGSDTTNIGGYCSSCGAVDGYTMFDDFTLSSSYNSLIVEWDASFYNILPTNSATTNVRIGIWQSENSTLLWSQLFTFGELDLISTNTTSSSQANLTVSALLSGVNLSTGSYWLSMSGDDMHFSTSATGTGASQISAGDLGTGFNTNQNLAMTFRIHDAASVPEPATIALIGLGLAGVGFSRKKKTA